MENKNEWINNISNFYYKKLKEKYPDISEEELEEKTNNEIIEIIHNCFKKN